MTTVETGNNSAFGDPEVRTRAILEAASGLLNEGGYPALTMRAIAQRSGMSAGLIYRYFTDKRDVFATLLHESQLSLTEQLRSAEATSVEGFLTAVAPPIFDQWFTIGRMATSYISSERHLTPAVQKLGESTTEQFAVLEARLREAAEAEGCELGPAPMMTRHVWASLMGLAESLMVGWFQTHDRDELITYSLASIARGIKG